MEKIPCIDCLVFPICKSKADIFEPYVALIDKSRITNVNIHKMLISCSKLQECVGKTNLFEKRRVKRIQLLKLILGVKHLDPKKVYRLFIDSSIVKWLDQFKGESLDFNKKYYEPLYKVSRRRKKHGNVRSKTRQLLVKK
jgi:hypothetical protein